jgi:hypothetical protein
MSGELGLGGSSVGGCGGGAGGGGGGGQGVEGDGVMQITGQHGTCQQFRLHNTHTHTHAAPHTPHRTPNTPTIYFGSTNPNNNP